MNEKPFNPQQGLDFIRNYLQEPSQREDVQHALGELNNLPDNPVQVGQPEINAVPQMDGGELFPQPQETATSLVRDLSSVLVAAVNDDAVPVPQMREPPGPLTNGSGADSMTPNRPRDEGMMVFSPNLAPEAITGLGGGQKVPKDSLRVQADGTVDEVNSLIGLALAQGLQPRLQKELLIIQQDLFRLGSNLSFLEADRQQFLIPPLEVGHIAKLENLMAELNEIVGPLQHFILPGGAGGAAFLHVARSVCRRAERDVVALSRQEEVGPFVLQYLNQLADVLFVMARYENQAQNVPEIAAGRLDMERENLNAKF